MGHAGAIVRHPNGLFEGAFDPRSNGAAASFLGEKNNDDTTTRLAGVSGAKMESVLGAGRWTMPAARELQVQFSRIAQTWPPLMALSAR